MNESGLRLRRRRYFLLRVSDEPTLDVGRFFRGEVALRTEPQCALLCPVRGQSVPLTPAEVTLAMNVPADRWVLMSELAGTDKNAHDMLHALARRGVLISDPASGGWDDLGDGEEVLDKAQWLDVAAVYHAHSRWENVVSVGDVHKLNEDAHRARLEELRILRGDPPPHFVQRPDAKQRTALDIPVLEGPFFKALLARRTTRAFRSDEALSMSALELMLYAVFGTHGIKHFADGIAAIKRTSPSGGALHPIEAYVLAMNVEQLAPGLYHYETATHALAELERMDIAAARCLASEFTAGQPYFAEAHALVIHVARFDRSFWKYAQHRKAYKAVLMDSAHLSQTFYLTAAHLGLGAFYTAAINDTDIARKLKLTPLREAAVAVNGVGIADDERNDLLFMPDPYQPTRISH